MLIVFQLVLDICNIKSKLEKGLKALDFMDININTMSNWLTEVEQKLDEIENTQLSEENLDSHIKYIQVKF